MLIRLGSTATLQLPQNGLKNLQGKARRLLTNAKSLCRTHSENSEQIDNRYQRSHKTSDRRNHASSQHMFFQQKMMKQELKRLA